MIAKTRAKPTKNDITKTPVTNNFLRTKHEGRSREYRFKVVAEQTEHSKVLSKTTEGQYCTVRASEGSLLHGTRTKLVYFEFAGFANKNTQLAIASVDKILPK